LAHSSSAGRGGPPAWHSPQSERPASLAVKGVREAGQTTPGYGQGGAVVLANGRRWGGLSVGEEKVERLGGGGLTKMGCWLGADEQLQSAVELGGGSLPEKLRVARVRERG
jgi:hypothetical protein